MFVCLACLTNLVADPRRPTWRDRGSGAGTCGGVDAALDANPHLAQGVNVRGGEVVLEAIKTKT